MMADKDTVIPLLKTAKGHIEGIIRMMEDNRYCIDISNQLFAVEAIIRKNNKAVLKAHILSCVRHASANGDEEKFKELTSLIDTVLK